MRRLVNDSRDVAKVAVSIPPGDSLEVSEALADQLTGQASSLRDDPSGSRSAELSEAIAAEAEAREAQRLADEAARNGTQLVSSEPIIGNAQNLGRPKKAARKAAKKAAPPADG